MGAHSTSFKVLSKSGILQHCLLLFSFILAYFPVWKSLVGVWYSSDDYSHGFFILPISLYIVWQKRKILVDVPFNTSWKGLLLVIFSLFLYLFAYYGEILTLASFSLVLMFSAVVIFFYGFKMFKELLFPLAFLLFMIPFPSQIFSQLTIPLQLFVTEISVWFMAHLGIPVYAEGNIIHLPNRTMQVVQACSGLRSMLSILPLGAILSYFTLNSNPLRYILFLSGIPTAILVNIVRVILLVMAYYYFNFDLTTGTTHTIFGIFIFILALIFLFAIRGILLKWDLRYTEK
jgi:exosortase A